MPQKFKVNDHVLTVRTRFRGIRKWSCFECIPYRTNNEPQIEVTISLDDDGTEYELRDIAIDELAVGEGGPASLAWHPDNLLLNFPYKVSLPVLVGDCEHRYSIAVSLGDRADKAASLRLLGGLVMSTGHVWFREKVLIGSLIAILPILGVLATLAVEHLILGQLVVNP